MLTCYANVMNSRRVLVSEPGKVELAFFVGQLGRISADFLISFSYVSYSIEEQLIKV